MTKAKKRSKRSGADGVDPSSTDHAGLPPTPGVEDLVGLLGDVTDALEQATAQIAGMAAEHPGTFPPSGWVGEPCGPSLGSQHGRSLPDPMLLDRYQGLLARSGIVGGSVHHLPSRSRERLETMLRELVVGVARGRPATEAQVEALVADLVAHIGDHIAGTVQDWRDDPD